MEESDSGDWLNRNEVLVALEQLRGAAPQDVPLVVPPTYANDSISLDKSALIEGASDGQNPAETLPSRLEVEALERYDCASDQCCSDCSPSAIMEQCSWGDYLKRDDVLALFREPQGERPQNSLSGTAPRDER